MKKYYFAGSIRGGRADAQLYQSMIDCLKHHGSVLTEHVGNLSLSTLEQGRDRDSDIYLQDTGWLSACDVVVAECTQPSLGVGYELAFAEKLGKPCHLFYNSTQCQLSAMLTGNPYFHIYPYTSEDELFALLDCVLNEE